LERGTRAVYYEGWHDEFDDDEEAIKCFMLGLTPVVRLKVTRRGGTAHKWTVYVDAGRKHEGFSTVALMFFPFWRKGEIVTLQNRWLEAPDLEPEK
jgi:hypothetical protein